MAAIVPPPLNPVWQIPSWWADYWMNVSIGELSGCWLWDGRLGSSGYGTFNQSTWATKRAHRISYMWANGPIPGSKVIDHLCRIPMCVNPSHLEAITNTENILRGMGQPAVNARSERCVKGHPLSGDNLLPGPLANGMRQCRLCQNDRARRRHYQSPTESPNGAACSGCGQERHVRRDGTMHKHRLPNRDVCPGSGQPPAVVVR